MFGLFVILSGFFTDVIGFTLEQWLRLVTAIFVSDIAGNLISSRLANRFGLRNTVIWMGAIVAIFSAWLGVAGIIWIFAGLYALSAVLLVPLRDPADLKSAPIAAH